MKNPNDMAKRSQLDEICLFVHSNLRNSLAFDLGNIHKLRKSSVALKDHMSNVECRESGKSISKFDVTMT